MMDLPIVIGSMYESNMENAMIMELPITIGSTYESNMENLVKFL